MQTFLLVLLALTSAILTWWNLRLRRSIQQRPAPSVAHPQPHGTPAEAPPEGNDRDQKLFESEARESAILESALDCVITIDLEGRVVEFNPASERTFGYERGSVLGKSMAELIVPDHLRDAHYEGMRKFRATGEGPVLGNRIEIEAMRSDGSTFPIELAITPIELESGMLFTAYVRDITERVENEKRLEQARMEAVRANELKTRFLASMSHEIRTPMTAVVGYSGLLTGGSMSPEDQHAWIVRVQRNGEYLLSLLDNVLDMSKIEAGELYLQEEASSVATIVDDVEALMRPRAEERALGFRVRYASKMPRRIVTDSVRVRQILVNLVSNAIKYTEKGEVELALSSEGSGERRVLRFEVNDTGPGIPEDKLGKIFEPFAQVESGNGSSTGTGLGLDISRRLAKMLGGKIEVTSTVGQGSCFVFELEATVDGQRSMDRSSSGASRRSKIRDFIPEHLRGIRVLVVDDVIDNVHIAKYMLKQAGITADDVTNGVDCVEQVLRATRDEVPYDVVLMDMQMPEMDGYETTRQLRLRGIETPIIALTAFALVGDREKCLAAGCNAYLTKPVVPEQLFSTIAKHLPAKDGDPGSENLDPVSIPLHSTRRDEDGFTELLTGYVARIATVRDDITAAAGAGDVAETTRLVHGVKGSSASYGFDEVSRVAAKSEQILRDCVDPTDIALEEVVAPVLDILDRVSSD